MAWHCRSCKLDMDSAQPDATTGTWRCPSCGAEVALAPTEVQPPAAEPTLSNDDGSADPAETVFQPALMMESIMDELDSEEPTPTGPGTEELAAGPETAPAPYLQLEVEAYLLILGASPGEEKRPLSRAKTVFGRQDADVALDDPAVSGAHFQIEAFGREFFLRDLGSRNGTFLNGTQVRYSQVLPGDQITAGKTSLIFRLSDDRIDRR